MNENEKKCGNCNEKVAWDSEACEYYHLAETPTQNPCKNPEPQNKRFSKTEKGLELVLEASEGNPDIAIDMAYGEGFKAGQEILISKMKICDIDSCENPAILKVCQEHTFEAGQESMKEVMPEKCSECNGRLNVWIGSHTSVRIQTMGGTKWLCTNCWNKEERQKVLNEIEKIIENTDDELRKHIWGVFNEEEADDRADATEAFAFELKKVIQSLRGEKK